MSIELEQRLRQLELRLDELERRFAAAPPSTEESTAMAKEADVKPRRRDATGRFAR